MTLPATLRIRPMIEIDLDAVLALEAGSDSAPHWGRGEYRVAIEQDASSAVRRLAMVADTDGVVAGFAVIRMIMVVGAGEAELESIVVAAQRRRQGIGNALLSAAVVRLRALGVGRLDLEVRASNAAARRFYEWAGFVETGLRREYYRHPEEDAVLMSISL